MKVLVACEFSGIVRDAFAARGHDAWSCDLLPSERPGNHIQGDVLLWLDRGWDLMIAHPPCTYLSYAAMSYWNRPGRAELRKEAMAFFMKLYDAPIPKICIENPKGEPMTAFRSPDQIIQPYYFGDPQQKTTCLWLKNLPLLEHLEQDTLFGEKQTHVNKPKPVFCDKTTGHKRYFTDALSDGKGHGRSRTFQGIANAMAEQWG
jgi:hypothetical protein